MDRLRCNLISARRYGFLFLILFGLGLQAEVLAGTWAPQTSPTAQNLGGVYFRDALTGWVVGAASTILNTTDGGVTWTPPATNPATFTGLGVRENATVLWAGGGQGVTVSGDNGLNWIDGLATGT